jgi:hypothetical protein
MGDGRPVMRSLNLVRDTAVYMLSGATLENGVVRQNRYQGLYKSCSW